MPQLNAIVLKDDANVDHTFTPNDISGGVATLVESTGVPLGDKRLSISQVKQTSGRRKVTAKFVIPTTQDALVNGVTRKQISHTAYADIVITFDALSSTQERKDALAYIESLMGNSLFVSMAGDLQGVY